MFDFYKMQGCGNDFIIIDELQLKQQLTKEQVIFLCNRHYGIGCDQLIIFNYEKNTKVKIQIYNSNGSVAYSCGNGIRCIGFLMKILHNKNEVNIQVVGGNTTYTKLIESSGNSFATIYAELGKYTVNQNDDGYLVKIGNKHLVIVVDNIKNVDMGYGEYLSKKHNINVSFVEYFSSNAIARVYESGSGETMACGSAAAAIHISNETNIDETQIMFAKSSEKIIAGIKNKSVAYIIGGATFVYKGKIKLN
jgi:diaminopimelate epimerase